MTPLTSTYEVLCFAATSGSRCGAARGKRAVEGQQLRASGDLASRSSWRTMRLIRALRSARRGRALSGLLAGHLRCGVWCAAPHVAKRAAAAAQLGERLADGECCTREAA